MRLRIRPFTFAIKYDTDSVLACRRSGAVALRKSSPPSCHYISRWILSESLGMYSNIRAENNKILERRSLHPRVISCLIKFCVVSQGLARW